MCRAAGAASVDSARLRQLAVNVDGGRDVTSPGSEQPGTEDDMQDKGRQGFASMDRATQRAIASAGGKAAHARGTAYQWTKAEAAIAGRKGGTVSRGGRGRLVPSTVPKDGPSVGADVPGGGANP